jgi:hypothetical protein
MNRKACRPPPKSSCGPIISGDTATTTRRFTAAPPGTGRFVHAKGLFDPQTICWANTTRIVQLSDDSWQQPSYHDAALSLVMSSIEIGIRRVTQLNFISYLDDMLRLRRRMHPVPSPFPSPDWNTPSPPATSA